jgi:hypothetical protein
MPKVVVFCSYGICSTQFAVKAVHAAAKKNACPEHPDKTLLSVFLELKIM